MRVASPAITGSLGSLSRSKQTIGSPAKMPPKKVLKPDPGQCLLNFTCKERRPEGGTSITTTAKLPSPTAERDGESDSDTHTAMEVSDEEPQSESETNIPETGEKETDEKSKESEEQKPKVKRSTIEGWKALFKWLICDADNPVPIMYCHTCQKAGEKKCFHYRLQK